MNTFVLTAAIDDRAGVGKVSSRIGIECDAHIFRENDDLCAMITKAHQQEKLHCILIDESQFLNKSQVKQLTYIVDILDIPVLCYGIKTDFQGELFEGSQYLFAWADKLVELKTICHCGRKATMVLRLNTNGEAIQEGQQVEIGGNDIYSSVCRKHFREALWDK